MSDFVRPLAGSPSISRSFARHVEQKSVNPGVDYAVGTGTPVHAPASGVIQVDDDNPGGAAGISVVIYHDNGWSSDLLHLSRNVVVAGQRVAQGQLVGYSGNTGASTGPHLHWSLRPKHISYYANVGNVDGESKIGPANPWTDHHEIQRRLNAWAAYDGATLLVVDGVLGRASKARILDFQQRRGLVDDGKVGQATWGVLIQNPPVPTPPVVPEPPVVVPEPEVPVVPEPEVPVNPEPEIPVVSQPEPTPEPEVPAVPQPEPEPPVIEPEPEPAPQEGWLTRIITAILRIVDIILGRK